MVIETVSSGVYVYEETVGVYDASILYSQLKYLQPPSIPLEVTYTVGSDPHVKIRSDGIGTYI